MAQPTSQLESFAKNVFRVLPALGVMCLVGGLALAFQQQALTLPAMTMIVLAHVFFLALFLKTEHSNLRYYLHVTIYGILVIGIATVIYLFAKQYTQKMDLTSQKLFSLSDESVKYLKKLDEDVSITMMVPKEAERGIDDISNRYNTVTKRLTWKTIDPVKQPVEAGTYGDNVQTGDVYIKSKLGSKKISVTEVRQNYENSITNAIVEVTRKQKPKIYFLDGHGEVSYEKAPPPQRGATTKPPATSSLGAVREFLAKRAMETAQLNLSESAGAVPADATVLVIAGPTRDIFPAEVKALTDYLGRNGKLLVLLPGPTSSRAVDPYTNLKSVLTPYGIDLPDEIVIDMLGRQLLSAQAGPSAAYMPIVQSFDPACPVTANMEGRIETMVLMPSRPVRLHTPPQGLTGWEFIKSSKSSWTQDTAGILTGAAPRTPAASDIKAQPLGVAIGPLAPQNPAGPPTTKQPDGARLVVFGNAQLIEDQFITSQQTAVQLMLNTVNWLTAQDDMISIAPREVKGTPIVLNSRQLLIIFVFAALAIPEALFFGGLAYSLSRRRS